MDRWKELYRYYRENPAEFYETYLGIKLSAYQRSCLKALNSKESIVINARLPYKKSIHNSMVEWSKAMKKDFYVVTPKGIEEYRDGELVD